MTFTAAEQLTDEQRECVTFNRRPHLLIKGPAGSGKSVVLLLRAHELKKGDGGESRLLTYVNTLVKNTEELAQRVLAQSPHRPDIRTYHSWCAKQLARLRIFLNVVGEKGVNETQADYIAAALAGVRERDYVTTSNVRNNPVEWWIDEFAWIKGVLLSAAV